MPMLLNVPYHFLYPVILVLCFLGAYTSTSNMFILYLILAFTLVGLFMKWGDLPTSPFILAFVLGSVLEENLRKAVSFSDAGWITFLTRPVSLILIVISVGSIIWPFISDARRKKAGQ